MSIGYIIKDLIHRLILAPFSANLQLDVLSNNVCCIMLQGYIWEHNRIYTSIKDWVRIPNTNHNPHIILRAADDHR